MIEEHSQQEAKKVNFWEIAKITLGVMVLVFVVIGLLIYLISLVRSNHSKTMSSLNTITKMIPSR